MNGSVISEIVWAVFALLVIIGACELFTNGIEWFGRKCNLNEGVVGSILAAVGTALPETLVPLVAILLVGGRGGHEVGIGGILGAPFMLATLAFFITGLGVFLFHRRRPTGLQMSVHARILRRDVGTFVTMYLFAVVSAFLSLRWLKAIVAVVLLFGYGAYVWLHFQDEVEEEGGKHNLRALYFSWWCSDNLPRLRYTILQSLVALAAIFLGAHLFVEKLTALCTMLGADARLVALIVVPIATELPEKFNSVLWVRQGKDTLALGNITGAMVFQSCIPVSVGLLLTEWQLTPNDFISIAVTLVSGIIIYISLWRTARLSPYLLLAGLLGYVVFLMVVMT
ncbi:MAG: sodium:calcium antiporter [Candidatus Zipacnadales bacterium]